MAKFTSLKVSYKFWPVGQGLFSSGRLEAKFKNSDKKFFDWVYDCGTVSNQKFLKNSIEEYKKSFRSSSNADSNIKPKIDLVVISHFDKDHISGLVELLNTFSIQTLLLPYMPLWQRLIIAFNEDIDSTHEMFKFFINPVQYIFNNSNEDVTEILFVRPRDEGRPDSKNQENSNGSSDADHSLIINTNRPDIDDDEEKKFLTDNKKKIRVYYSGRTIKILGFWEFIPYNDANVCFSNSARTWDDFKEMVNKHRDALLQSPSEIELNNIKNIYDQQFGSDSKSRNIISLFLYAGPRLARPTVWHCNRCYFHSQNLLSRVYEYIHLFMRAGVLYTGDGYLNEPVKLNKLLACIGKQSIKKICCLQVMHHGSSANWHEGIAKTLEPDISVFCSDPSHLKYKHPHGDVVRDFLKYNPVQVDRTNGVEIVLYFSSLARG